MNKSHRQWSPSLLSPAHTLKLFPGVVINSIPPNLRILNWCLKSRLFLIREKVFHKWPHLKLPGSRWKVQELHEEINPFLVLLVGHAVQPWEVSERLGNVEFSKEGQFLGHVSDTGTRDTAAWGSRGLEKKTYTASWKRFNNLNIGIFLFWDSKFHSLFRVGVP